MTGADADGYAAIAINRGAPPQAFGSSPPESSTITKSAVSGLSTICTRTVAACGTSVNATCRSACQGVFSIWDADPPASMQGLVPGNNSLRANRPARISGTAEARIPKRNMTRYSLNLARKRRAYGWRRLNRTGYRWVDGAGSDRRRLFRQRV